jgi:hypothetical protein
MRDADNSLSKRARLVDWAVARNTEEPMPTARRKDDRRKDNVPASVLGGFLREDRRKVSDRRRRKNPPKAR